MGRALRLKRAPVGIVIQPGQQVPGSHPANADFGINFHRSYVTTMKEADQPPLSARKLFGCQKVIERRRLITASIASEKAARRLHMKAGIELSLKYSN